MQPLAGYAAAVYAAYLRDFDTMSEVCSSSGVTALGTADCNSVTALSTADCNSKQSDANAGGAGQAAVQTG
jgi:hypothetical protein